MNNLTAKENKTSIVFTGDIGFDKYMSGKWEDDELLSTELIGFFKSGDHVCINVEGAVIEVDDTAERGQFFHAMNPGAIRVFEKMGADIWSIGNNHTMDAGAEGIASTVEYAKKSGAMCFGAGMNLDEASRPVYLDEAGGIGILGVSYMSEKTPATEDESGFFRWDDMARIKARIDEIKARCRWCVIVAHGGEEFAPMPLPYTRVRYLQYLDMGADVVVGHHPHVPENYEITDDGKMIFYSLGNFIFDTDYQRVHPYTDTGVVLKLVFSKDKVSFEAVGTKINRVSERIELGELPAIFTNVHGKEYELLAPLAAKAFMTAEKKKMIYLDPERFVNADSDAWRKYFFSTEPDGYAQGEHMDLSLAAPLADEEAKGAWRGSALDGVKEYLQNQIQ